MRFATWALVVVVLLAVLGGCTYMLRRQAVDACRDRGGQPVTPPWWVQDQLDVRCLEAGR